VKKLYCDRNVTISEPNHSRQEITKSLGKDTPSTVIFKGNVTKSVCALELSDLRKAKSQMKRMLCTPGFRKVAGLKRTVV
jgi:hypothetical protein